VIAHEILPAFLRRKHFDICALHSSQTPLIRRYSASWERSDEPKQKDRPKAASGLRTSQSSNVPSRNSSPTTSVAAAVVTSENAAFGNCSQTARSSAVTVSHPNLNMYRPGSVTRPTCAQVTLLTANHFPFAFSPG
jgi:hypothetical protein